jgi:hypothetical protein
MSSSELDTLQSAFREAGGKWSTFVIWAKNIFTLGRADYQRQYEPILYGGRTAPISVLRGEATGAAMALQVSSPSWLRVPQKSTR